MVCARLREISRSFLRESSRLRIFVRGVNAKKELFSWTGLYLLFIIQTSPFHNKIKIFIFKIEISLFQ